MQKFWETRSMAFGKDYQIIAMIIIQLNKAAQKI